MPHRPPVLATLVALAALASLETSARADAPPARPPPAERTRFGAAILNTYTHQQQNAWYVFNSQRSELITESSEARRLQFEWRFLPEAQLQFGFVFPTRDESLRKGTEELQRYHFPKQLLAGAGWDVLQLPLSSRGALELGLSGGVVAGIARPFLDLLLPWVQGETRIALASGSALSVGMQYAGVLTRGSFSMSLGASQRF